jgi:hypothetical protein
MTINYKVDVAEGDPGFIHPEYKQQVFGDDRFLVYSANGLSVYI